MAISYLFSVITTYTTKIPLILFPIFTRQYSILLLEYPRKCLTSRKSIFFRNHTDRKIRIHQIIHYTHAGVSDRPDRFYNSSVHISGTYVINTSENN